jgi:hypothetical protein
MSMGFKMHHTSNAAIAEDEGGAAARNQCGRAHTIDGPLRAVSEKREKRGSMDRRKMSDRDNTKTPLFSG